MAKNEDEYISEDFEEEEQANFNKFRPLFLKSGLNLESLFALLKTAFEELPLCQIGTIHSFCNEMLRKLNYFAYL